MRKTVLLLTISVLAGALSVPAQTPSAAPANKAGAAAKPNTAPGKKLTPQQQFVLDVVQSAVGRMIPAPQDRLRVLATAISVVNPVSPKLAKQYAAEGVRLEGQMIGSGEVPSASMMETGLVDCRTATEFVDQLPAPKVTDAEQSIIGAVNICPQAVQAAQAKLDVGASQGQVAPRAFMATAQHAGVKSPWSQSRFEKLMAALPDPKSAVKEAPNFAAMYSTMAPQVDKAVAQKSGISLLDWLAKLNDVPERNLAIRITTDGMKKALGTDAYEEALRNDVVAQQTSRLTGSMELARPEEENVSVLQAMSQKGQDQTEAIKGMPPTLRAKEAAAAGFAEGTSGNKVQSAKYFDIAFSALDESWQSHPEGKNLAGTVEEVCEAASQVNYVDALKRAEQLGAPAEQAIGMLAVARTVLGKSL